MNPQPMCWQTVVLTVVVSMITGTLILTVLQTAGYDFKQVCWLIGIIILGMSVVVAVCTRAKWFLDAVISKIPLKGGDNNEPAPKA